MRQTPLRQRQTGARWLPRTVIATKIHPALNSFADECCGTLARLIAYLGVLALFAIAGIYLWDRCRRPQPLSLPPKRAGVRLPVHTPHSASSISQEKQKLARSSGIPKGAARTSFARPPKAKSRLQNAGFIAPVASSANPGPLSPNWPHEWSPAARTSWKPLASSTANSDSKFGPRYTVSPGRRAGRHGFLPRFHQGSRRSQLRISGWSLRLCRRGSRERAENPSERIDLRSRTVPGTVNKFGAASGSPRRFAQKE
jgi:hypothetical protein